MNVMAGEGVVLWFGWHMVYGGRCTCMDWECGIVRLVCSRPCSGILWRMLESNEMIIVWKLVLETGLVDVGNSFWKVTK